MVSLAARRPKGDRPKQGLAVHCRVPGPLGGATEQAQADLARHAGPHRRWRAAARPFVL